MNASTKQRFELSVIPRGCWRNCYESLTGYWLRGSTGEKIQDPLFVAKARWPSREIAEEKAAECLRKARLHKWQGYEKVRYFGAQFFPDP